MTRNILIILLLTCLGIATTAADKPVSSIVFETKTHDFGMIDHNGGPVSYDFKFTNAGNASLVIVSATASCGCTQPKYNAEPVRAGKSGKIKVTFLPETTMGAFSKTVKVRTNDPKNRKLTLTIKGTVYDKAEQSKDKASKPAKND